MSLNPTAVVAVAGTTGTGSATLSWTAPSTGTPTAYWVWANSTAGVANGGTLLGPYPATVTSATVFGLVPGETYYFYVNTPQGGYSAASNSLLIPASVVSSVATYTTDSSGNVTGLSGTVTTASGQSSQQFFSPFVATHTASIDARTMPSGAVTAATSGVLRTIAGAAASLINISGGAINLPPTTNGNSVYISLQCDDTVQYMRAILSYPSVCTGGFTMIIPLANGNFPGTGNSTGSGDAGVHAGLACWTGSVNETYFSAGGYGPNAGAITGYAGQDVSATIPLQGHTVTVELFCNKYSGRVTLAINNDIVGDYTDLRTISYLGPYAVFELGASTTNGNNPSIILMEASSQYIQPAVGLVPKAYANYPGSVVNMTSSLTSLFTAQAASGAPNGCAALVIASVFITQASGDCQMRLYDGASGYSGTQVVARGSFTGRVTYIQSFVPSTTSPAPNVQVQIANTAGVGTVNQGSDTNVDYVVVLPIPHYQI